MKTTKKIALIALAGCLAINSCKKATDTPVAFMSNLTTTAVTNITGATVQSGGNITSDGSNAVTSRGVCWSTTAGPTTANSKTTDGPGTGTFTSAVTGLSVGTTYYIRAYATNSTGTQYRHRLW